MCLCESQAKKWTEEQRDRFFDIAYKCYKETLIQHHHTPDCMHKRNRYMVDQADFIIAIWDGQDRPVCPTARQAGHNYQSENDVCRMSNKASNVHLVAFEAFSYSLICITPSEASIAFVAAELTAMHIHMTMTIIPSSIAIAIMGRTVRTIACTMSRMRSVIG